MCFGWVRQSSESFGNLEITLGYFVRRFYYGIIMAISVDEGSWETKRQNGSTVDETVCPRWMAAKTWTTAATTTDDVDNVERLFNCIFRFVEHTSCQRLSRDLIRFIWKLACDQGAHSRCSYLIKTEQCTARLARKPDAQVFRVGILTWYLIVDGLVAYQSAFIVHILTDGSCRRRFWSCWPLQLQSPLSMAGHSNDWQFSD